MPSQSYQLFQAERPKSASGQQAVDARCGKLAAAISRRVTAASARIHAVVCAAPAILPWPARLSPQR